MGSCKNPRSRKSQKTSGPFWPRHDVRMVQKIRNHIKSDRGYETSPYRIGNKARASNAKTTKFHKILFTVPCKIRKKRIRKNNKILQNFVNVTKFPVCGVIILIPANRKIQILLDCLSHFANFVAILLVNKIRTKFCSF